MKKPTTFSTEDIIEVTGYEEREEEKMVVHRKTKNVGGPIHEVIIYEDCVILEV